MKTDKKSIIAFICVLLSCILVIGVTIGLLSSASNTPAMGTADTASTKTDNKTDNTEDPPAEEPQPEPELEWGYKFEKKEDSVCNFLSIANYAYKSQKRTRNINAATITISFGALDGDRYFEDCSIPEYSIYFASPDDLMIYEGYYLDHSIYDVKTVKEQIFSEKYKITHVRDRDEIYEYYEFAHTEEITIPKELFTQNSGRIVLCIGGTNVSESKDYVKNFIIGAIDLKYQRKGTDEVVLFHCWED